jgi:hypothetical protein
MIRHAYRMRTTMMIHSKAIYRDVTARDKSVSIPAGAMWGVPESRNPWKSSEPFTESELLTFLRNGIANHPLVELGFEPIAFSEDLVPAAPLDLKCGPPGKFDSGRGRQTFFTWIDNAAQDLQLQVTGGLIAHYRDRGNVRIDLWQLGGATDDGNLFQLIAHDESVPPDGKTHPVQLACKQPGLHRVDVSDGRDKTRIAWGEGTPVTFRSSLENPINLSGRWSLYFYVPRGTKVVGLFGERNGEIRDADGRKALSLEGKQPGYHAIPVGEGQDGRLWKIHQGAGSIRLLTVPPYLARTPDELLLPREVIESDR